MSSTLRAWIDLGTGESRIEAVENQRLIEQLGGIGRSLPWFLEHTGRVADPFAPESTVMMNTGVFTGSKLMTGLRVYFTAYSPLKRSKGGMPGIMYSAASGNLGQELAFTGLCDVLLTGRCAGPSYLWIDGVGEAARLELRDGAELAGLRTGEKVRWLKARHPDAHFGVIGPAGENGVAYAAIACSTDRQTRRNGKFMRFAGRGGMGAVLGSKNVLAVAIQGGDRSQRDFSKELLGPLNKRIARGEDTSKYRDHGTWLYNIEILTSPRGGLPVRNFSAANAPEARVLYRGAVEETHAITDENCVQCGIKCWKIVNTKEGKPLAKVDYEPLDLLGPNLGIFDIEETCRLIEDCDELGMDAISAGGVLGYLMEHGLDGQSFGDVANAHRLLEDVAHGRNPRAAGGVKAISEAIGQTATAIHVHGLELAAYLGNTDPAAAFALAGNHMSMATYGLAGKMGQDTIEEWCNAVPKTGLATLLQDMTGVCKFAKVKPADYAALLGELGITASAEELAEAWMEVYRLGRRIDARQGFTAADDVLPERCFERLPGQGVRQFNTPEFFQEFKARLYARLGIAYEAPG